MARKALLMSAAGGLASLLLSGCVYGSGSFHDSYGKGVYAGGGVILGRNIIFDDQDRHHRWYDDDRRRHDWRHRRGRSEWRRKKAGR